MILKEIYGALPDGRAVDVYRLQNKNGISACILSLGGIITEFNCPDRQGKLKNIVLKLDDAAAYDKQTNYIGALVGRYANRIANSRFYIDGTEYKLTPNDGQNHLHGGASGFDKKIWDADIQGNDLTLTLHSPNGEEGYPGNLDVTVTYTLTDQNELKIHYHAVSDRSTYVNLTNHAFFNLSGEQNILNHKLMINAERYTPVDEQCIPYGHHDPVAKTPLDFRTLQTIGARMGEDNIQLKNGNGYDQNFMLNAEGDINTLAALCVDETSGRTLSMYTTKPGVQFYTGNFLNNDPYPQRSGLCLEPQYVPNSPNVEGFDIPVLRPGDVYEHMTIYQVSVKE